MAARGQVVLAARAAGVQRFDTVFTNLDDQAGFEREVLQNKAMGFDGKSLINPKQIRFVHQTFAPTQKEIAQAEKIVLALVISAAAGILAGFLGALIFKPLASPDSKTAAQSPVPASIPAVDAG